MLDPSSAWGCENVLMKWGKVKITDDSWRNALARACSVGGSRVDVHCQNNVLICSSRSPDRNYIRPYVNASKRLVA